MLNAAQAIIGPMTLLERIALLAEHDQFDRCNEDQLVDLAQHI